MESRQSDNVSVCVWQDTRLVKFMSSVHNLLDTQVIKRKKGDGTLLDVNCPQSIIDYNKYMGGVDRADQYRKYYHVHVKLRKSYKYIFWFLFEICVLNAFILSWYSPSSIMASTYLSLRHHLANTALPCKSTYETFKQAGRVQTADDMVLQHV